MPDHVLSNSAFRAVIEAPIEHVDVSSWLLSLPDAEYQRCCPPDHVAAGATTTEDGTAMSINVEQIGDDLLVQHYVGEILDKRHCKLVSRSDVYTAHGRTRVNVIWDLSVKPLDDERCEYTNVIVATTTPEFLAFIAEHGITLADAAAARQAAASDHNRRETPRLAKSIEREARALHAPTAELPLEPAH